MLGSQPESPASFPWWGSYLSHGGSVRLLRIDVEAVTASVAAVEAPEPTEKANPRCIMVLLVVMR